MKRVQLKLETEILIYLQSYQFCFIMYFFFQAEDGIRDWSVTGVQTCALPICPYISFSVLLNLPYWSKRKKRLKLKYMYVDKKYNEIGRASCRERVQISVVAVSLKKKYYNYHTNRSFYIKYKHLISFLPLKTIIKSVNA